MSSGALCSSKIILLNSNTLSAGQNAVFVQSAILLVFITFWDVARNIHLFSSFKWKINVFQQCHCRFFTYFLYPFIHCRLWGSWSQSQLTLGKGTPLTSRKSIAGPKHRWVAIHTYLHTYGKFGVAVWPNPLVCGSWEKTRIPRN